MLMHNMIHSKKKSVALQ